MMNQTNSAGAGILALRVGCGLFALTQGLFKFLLPSQTFVWLGMLVTPRPGGIGWPFMALGVVEILLGLAILVGLALSVCGWVFAAWSLFYGTLAIGGVVVSGGIQMISGEATPAIAFSMFIAQAMVAGFMPAGIALSLLSGPEHPTV